MARRPPSASQRKQRSRQTPKWLTKKTDLNVVARNRVLLVLSVLSGEKPVTTAIDESGISRGFYYQLETKALNAMLLALAPGADGDPSPDATGLHQRIKDLETKVQRAEQTQRRAERLLFLQRKMMSPGPVKTHRGRPPKTTTSSTPAGRKSWRSSMTTSKPKMKSSSSAMPPSPSTPTKQASNPPPSIPMPAGGNVAP